MFIQIDVHLKHHRKTRKLAQMLNVSPREAMSYLICLWSTAALEAEDGVLAGWDDREIACASDYDGGEADRFVKALLESGWLEGDRTLHGWQKHYGRHLQARKKSRERWQAWEERQKNPARRRHASGAPAARLAASLPFPFSSSPPTTPSSPLSQSYPLISSSIFSSRNKLIDSTATSGEERGGTGGKGTQHITADTCHATAGGGIPLRPPLVPSDDDRTGPSPVSAPGESEQLVLVEPPHEPQPVITIPVLPGKSGQAEFGVYRDQVDEWSELFPAVDVEQELRTMRAWCLANPDRRKTSRGVMRFITGWLAREQNRAGRQREDPFRKTGYGFLTATLGEEPETED